MPRVRSLRLCWVWLAALCAGCNALTGVSDLVFREDAGRACDAASCCEDECEALASRCEENLQQTCGDYDEDSCREWGGDVECGPPGCGAQGCLELPEGCEPPDGSPCAVLPVNCGCDVGMACQLDLFTGAPSCQRVGMSPTHGACESSEDCALGNICLPLVPGEVGVCYPYCSSDSPCVRGSCEVLAPPAAPLSVCFAGCDPVDPRRTDETFTACAPGVYCSPVASGVGEIALCVGVATPRSSGAACDGGEFSLLECAAGLTCRNDVCTAWCRSDADCVGAPCPSCVGDGYLAGADDRIGYCMGNCPPEVP